MRKKMILMKKMIFIFWVKNGSIGRYTTAAVKYCCLVHGLSAYNPGGLRWFESGCHRKKK